MNQTTTATAAPDKAALRNELEATHAEYRELVGQITDGAWNAKSGNAGWTCGQLAWHLAEGVKFSSGLVMKTREGKQTNPPSFLLPLAFKANEFIVRRKSRNATRESVLEDYRTSLDELLRLLDDVREEEFSRSATNYGITRTIEEMFRNTIEHFAEHGPEIRSAL